MNLVQSLGAGYFNEFFHNALFMYEGRVHMVVEVRSSNVRCTRLHDGELVNVPNNFFLGFKTFNYPLLGYRRLDENTISFLTRNQSVRRGLNESHVRHNYSPVTTRLMRDHYIPSRSAARVGLVVFEPVYDRAADIKAMLAGDKTGVVLSDRVIIEPSVSSGNDWYTIYHGQTVAGSMDYRGRPAFSHQKYENLIAPLLQ